MKNDYFWLSQQIALRGYFWVQGAGGNVSVKNGNELDVKPSGQRLDAVTENSQSAKIDLNAFLQGLENLKRSPSEQQYSELIQKCSLNSVRASMETGFHAALKFKYVAHFHSLVSFLISYEYRQNSLKVQKWLNENHFEKTFGPVSFLPLSLPGLQLSLQVASQNAQVYFLEQHGIILASDDLIPFERLWELEAQFCRDFGYNESLAMIQKKEHSLKAPLHFYFPDFCIVFPKLVSFLEKEVNGEMQLKNECQELNLQEIWWSHCFLHKAQPNFQGLPEDYIQAVSNLPTEILRKKILQVRES